MKRLGKVGWLGAVLLSLVALLAIAAGIWWGAIREALMDPGVAYQTFTPPPAPDYADPGAWALLPEGEPAGPADIFFVHPTTYQGRSWNAAFDAESAANRLSEVMIPNYAGPFAQAGRVFAPRYRQASLYTQLTLRQDAREARAFAYGDVRAALEVWAQVYDTGRPLVIVGVEQGGFIAQRLIDDLKTERPEIIARLAAVYLIETPVPASAPALPPCEARGQAGCLVAYLAEGVGEARLTRERLRHAAIWRDGAPEPLGEEATVCVNPLTGTASGLADAETNIGAADASGLDFGEEPGFQARQVGAACQDGILMVTRPRSASLRGRRGWADAQRVRPYNWFYADLAADVLARVSGAGGPPVEQLDQ